MGFDLGAWPVKVLCRLGFVDMDPAANRQDVHIRAYERAREAARI